MPSSHENSGLVGINLSKILKEHNFPGHRVIILPVWSQLHSLFHLPHTESHRGLFSVFLLMDKEQGQENQWVINSVGNRFSPLGWSGMGEVYFMDCLTQRARRHECVIYLFFTINSTRNGKLQERKHLGKKWIMRSMDQLPLTFITLNHTCNKELWWREVDKIMFLF